MDRTWVVAGCIAAAALAGAVVLWPSPGTPPALDVAVSPPGSSPTSPAGSSGIVVHVSGAVARPGLVSLPEGARVADAIVAAGGALADASLATVNLAAPVTNGQSLVIPGAGTPMSDSGAGAYGRVAVNHADRAALERLPGVGPVLAERILAHRQQHGPFTSVEALLDVPGIGEAKLAALREHIAIP